MKNRRTSLVMWTWFFHCDPYLSFPVSLLYEISFLGSLEPGLINVLYLLFLFNLN